LECAQRKAKGRFTLGGGQSQQSLTQAGGRKGGKIGEDTATREAQAKKVIKRDLRGSQAKNGWSRVK